MLITKGDFHIDKMNDYLFQKVNSFLKIWNYWIFHDLLSSEIIQSVAFDNYDDFQQVNFIFSQKFIPLFWGLFNDETDLKVRYTTTMK